MDEDAWMDEDGWLDVWTDERWVVVDGLIVWMYVLMMIHVCMRPFVWIRMNVCMYCCMHVCRYHYR